MPFTSPSKPARPEDMAEAYLKEQENWIKYKAFTLVKLSAIPIAANVISSHVIYKWKKDGILKTRIVHHGHQDNDKDFMRKDSPTMAVEVLRIVVSIAVERGWRLGSLDVKAAYLQAMGFNREICVR
jgi:Reverse transcriptase (RNA-dependent DNA polymerase)